MLRLYAFFGSTLVISSFLGASAEAQRAPVPTKARIVRPAKVMTSAPLAQLAALAGPEPRAREVREINPLGMPPVPLGLSNPEAWIDPLRRDAIELAPAPAPYRSFEGVNNRNSVSPPDTNGDVGKDHYVQWVNLSLQIFDKTTGASLLGPVNGNTLWVDFGGICQSNNNGDPVVLYDPLADRWILSQFGLGASGHQCIAISATPDPSGPYHLYDYIVTPGGTNDYPKFGIWDDAYLYMANEFAPGFVGALIGGFERQKMLVGDPTALLVFFALEPGLLGATHFAPEPANLEGMTPPPAGRPALFVQPIDTAVWGGPVDRYNLWEVEFDFAVPANSTAVLTQLSAGVPSFNSFVCASFNACIPQGGTSNRLDSLAQFTMYRPVYRNFGTHEVLLVNHTVNAGGGVAGIRWTEIRDPFGAPTVHQTGTHSPNASHRWMGSIAMDGDGGILLGYSLSSSGSFPSIAYAGRSSSDPPGTLPLTETVLLNGTGSQTGSNRWGDYSTMSLDEVGDPALDVPPDCGFWFTSEYLQVNGSSPWRTRIGAIRLPDCGADLAADVGLAVNGQHPPSNIVITAGPVEVTLDMTPGASSDPLGWYYAIVVSGSTFWVTPTGLATTPAALLTAPPVALDDLVIFDSTLPSGTAITFVFYLLDGADLVTFDFITAVVS